MASQDTRLSLSQQALRLIANRMKPEQVKAAIKTDANISPILRWFYDYDSDQRPKEFADTLSGYGAAYKRSIWVNRCVARRSVSVSSVPLVLYAKKDEDDIDGKDSEIPSHPLTHLLKRVNPFIMNRTRLWYATEAALCLYGKAFWYKLRNQYGYPVELYWMHPRRMKIVEDKETFISHFEYDQGPGNPPWKIARNDIVYFHDWHPDSEVDGLSRMEAGIQIANADYEAHRFNETFFRNGARPSGILTTDQILGDSAAYRTMREQAESFYSGSRNAHRIMVLDQGLTYKPGEVTMKDMEFRQLLHLNREEICALFDVPGPLVGDMTRATYTNNFKIARRVFFSDVIIPHLGELADTVIESLLPDFMLDPNLFYLRFDTSKVKSVQEDQAEQVKTAHTLYTMGVPLNDLAAKFFDQLGPWTWGNQPIVAIRGAITEAALIGETIDVRPMNQPGDITGANEPRELTEQRPILPVEPIGHAPPASATSTTNVQGDIPEMARPRITSGKSNDSAVRAAIHADLLRWQTKALNRLKKGREASCDFESTVLPAGVTFQVKALLPECRDESAVKGLFDGLRDKTAVIETLSSLPSNVVTGTGDDDTEDTNLLGGEVVKPVVTAAQQAAEDAMYAALLTLFATHVRQVANRIKPGSEPGQDVWGALRDQLEQQLLPLIEGAITAGTEEAYDQVGVLADPADVQSTAAMWALARAGIAAGLVIASTQRAVDQAVANWLAAGQDNMALLKRLADILGERRAKVVAVNETTTAYTEGKRTVFEYSHIRRWKWIVTKDERLCSRCGPLDGKVVLIGTEFAPGIINPSAHVGCRCQVAAVLENTNLGDY